MSQIAHIIAELVRAGTDADLVGRVAEAFIEVAEVSQKGSLLAARSKGAERTARWRERRRLAASQTSHGDTSKPVVAAVAEPPKAPEIRGTDDVSVAAPVASSGDVVTLDRHKPSRRDARGQKEIPPTPPKEKLPPSQKGFPPRSARHGVTRRRRSEPIAVVDPRRWVEDRTPLHRELVAMFGEVPDRGGWYFDPEQIAAAEARLNASVTVLPVRVAGAGAAQEAQHRAEGAGEDRQEARAQR